MTRKTVEELTDLERQVMKENGTEAPFENEYWKHFEEGIYVDKLSGKPLFTSKDKFDSSCGWPSFSKSLAEGDVSEHVDTSFGMRRTEVRSESSDSHLGHVFPDGPPETGGLRYCINSAAIDFIPKSEMKDQGYEEYISILEARDQMKERSYYQYMKTRLGSKDQEGQLAHHIVDDMSFPKYETDYDKISDYLEKNPYLHISLDTFDDTFSDYKEWLKS